MKWLLTAACAAAISLSCAPFARAKGCIKGAIVGGVAGHMAGLGKLGAVAGCVVGHHEANKKHPNTQGTSKQKRDWFTMNGLNRSSKEKGASLATGPLGASLE
jgi:hypothetical protein